MTTNPKLQIFASAENGCAMQMMSMQTASETDAQFSTGWLLVSESATNILHPFNRAAEAADGIQQEP